MLVLLVYGSFGFRNGVVYSIGAVLGLVLGSVIAFLVVPHLGTLVPEQTWRVIVVLAVTIALIAGGHAAGTAIAMTTMTRTVVLGMSPPTIGTRRNARTAPATRPMTAPRA